MAVTLTLADRPDEEGLTDLHRHALMCLEESSDIEIDCSEMQYLDVGTLQLVLALKASLASRGRKLHLTGFDEPLLQWVRISGAKDLLPASGTFKI